jgi:hypothetical protein
MSENIGVRRIVPVGLVMSVVALTCMAVVARGATPVVTVGPTVSPTGGTATGTAASDGQTDACLDQQHSGASPSTASPPCVLQIADRSCAAPSGAGTPTTAAAPSASGSDGGGGGSGTTGSSGAAGTAGGTQSSTQSTTSTRSGSSSSTVSRRAAGSTTSSSTRASVAAAGARGLLITRIRSKIVQTKTGKHVRVVVTLRDRQRRLVRSAIVSVGRLPGAKTTLSRLRVRYSNRLGRAAFVVPVTKAMLGRRVLFRVRAHTPNAHVLKSGGVLVSGQRSHHKVTRFVASG